MYPSLVHVQPRKTRPCLTERLLIGRKELIKLGKTINANNHGKSIFKIAYLATKWGKTSSFTSEQYIHQRCSLV